MHVFDCATGVRKKKEHYNSTSLISMYCTRSNFYFHMDAACYSWLKKFKLSGFKPRDLTAKEVKELPDCPVVLDKMKQDIVDQIAEEKKSHEEEQQPGPYQNHILHQLLKQDGQFDLYKPPQEEQKRTTMSPDNITDICSTIIFSKMSGEARTAQFKITQLKDKRLEGEEMLPYIKAANAVYCSKSYLVALRQCLEEQIDSLNKDELTTQKQSNVLNLLHIYLTNINSLICCRINLKDIFDERELKAITSMQNTKLDSLKLIDGQKEKDADTLTPEEIFALHIVSMATKLNNVLESNIDSESRAEKLTSLEENLKVSVQNDEAPEANKCKRVLSQLSQKKILADLFEGSLEELEKGKRIIKICTEYSNKKMAEFVAK